MDFLKVCARSEISKRKKVTYRERKKEQKIREEIKK